MLKHISIPKLPRHIWLGLGFVALVLIAFLLLKSCGSDPTQDMALGALPTTPTPDADSPADTIKTLTASVSALLENVRELRLDNQELRDNNQILLEKTELLERDLTAKLQREINSRDTAEARSQGQQRERIEHLENRVEDLNDNLSRIRNQYAHTPISKPNASARLKTQPYQWLPPLEGSFSTVSEDVHLEPVYTIPKNATLVGSTSLTALIGRIPVEDRVRDPMPFKVITGNDNLATNGHRIPNLRGTIWSGQAIGDWTLSCVTGTLNSVTFVFDDGTIRTVDPAEARSNLGWITDAYGVPCLRGDRVSNFRPMMAAHLASGAVTGIANAAALAETERNTNAIGGTTSSVTGDIAKFMIGKSIANSSQSMTSWLNERSKQEFDAVVVPAGQKVVLQIDAEITIDYHPKGRKLTYAKNQTLHFAALD